MWSSSDPLHLLQASASSSRGLALGRKHACLRVRPGRAACMAGTLYFDTPTIAPTAFYDAFSGAQVGVVTLEQGVAGSVIVDPTSPPGQLPRARLRASSRGEHTGCGCCGCRLLHVAGRRCHSWPRAAQECLLASPCALHARALRRTMPERSCPAGQLPSINWVVRTNVTGGAAPTSCSCPRGKYYLVPYQAE